MRGMQLCVVVLVLSVGLGCVAAQPPEGAIPARILRWYDGDTVQVRFTEDPPAGVWSSEAVRLLGIDTPEVGEPFADDATRYLRSLTMGKTVYVELNPFELRDRHRRLLAHLWVETDDGWTLISEAIVRAGLARILVFYPEQERYYCRLLRARALAQVDKLGLWGAFPDPLNLEEMEARPVTYVTEVVTVVFAVASAAPGPAGPSLRAAGSQYGFRAILDLGTCPGAWTEVELAPEALVGQTVAVTGELLWDSFGGGPRIVVQSPEQVEVRE